MKWLAENWLWIVFAIVFVAMHIFGHGGHGGHNEQDEQENKSKNKKRTQKESDVESEHHHSIIN